jgi:protein-tyrosine phosphatase
LARRLRRRLRRWRDRVEDLRARWFGSTPALPRPLRVVFVCRGNICRSSYAEYWISKHRPDLVVESAGVHVRRSMPAPDAAITAAEMSGVDLKPHRSKSIHNVALAPETLYVVMEPWHAEESSMRERESDAIVVALGAWAQPRRAIIPDPYGRDVATFRETFLQMERALERLVSAWPTT